MDLIQKSKVKWEVEGDENSKFFHGLINSRRKSQMVQGIMLDDVWNSEPKDIKSAFLDFYKDKFSCLDSLVSFPPMLLAHCLSIADRDFHESMVSIDEIKEAVWDCGSQKALGPNDYRPISLIGTHYKIVAKILANRLSKVIDSIISPEQYAFITRRQILDGPLILSETIDWYKKGKKKMMLFKVDFEKAFESARISILINGSPTSEFSLKRGLSTRKTFGENTRDLGLILEETGQDCKLAQRRLEELLTEGGDGVMIPCNAVWICKRRRQNSCDGVRT
ncbi:RNA-directed DNA polymerase, eukaryota, reverse transcriptase zinc-binding domain protein [Tanacetum coccineum]